MQQQQSSRKKVAVTSHYLAYIEFLGFRSHPTLNRLGHFGDVLASQSLG